MSTTRSAPKLHLWLPGAARFFSPPNQSQAFDPRGAWQHSYVLLNSGWIPGASQPIRAEGFLEIRRTPGPREGRFALDVELLVRSQFAGGFRTAMRIDCSDAPLSTPVAWKLESLSLDAQGRPIQETRFEESGRVEQDRIVREGLRHRSDPAPAQYTANWCLFDAVQRIHAQGLLKQDGAAIEFDLLEDLDLWKPGQRLTSWGQTEASLADRPVSLTGYQQIGEGILPYHYWVDDEGRLLLAYGGLRAFIFHPGAASLVDSQTPPKKKKEG